GFLAALAGPGRTIVTATKTGGERNETRFPSYFVEAFEDNAADSDRNGRVSVFEAFEYARTKVAKSYEQQGLILTEHAALDDGNQGKLAATLFLESDRSRAAADRKSTRLNSSHVAISYAVFCLKKKRKQIPQRRFTTLSQGALFRAEPRLWT